MYLKETDKESPAFLRDNNKCQADGRQSFKKGGGRRKYGEKRYSGMGEPGRSIVFWQPAISVACLLQNEGRPSHSKDEQLCQ
jgi:hypothetical protein